MIQIADSKTQKFEINHINSVRAVAPECTLFLKKDGTFPIAAPCSAALYGSGARKTVKGGTGSGDVNVRQYVTIEQGLKNAGFDIISSDWMDCYDRLMVEERNAFIEKIRQEAKKLGISSVMHGMGKSMPAPNYEFEMDYSADMAVYVLGRDSGEGSDRSEIPGDIYLTETEIRDIKALDNGYEKFILVLNTGGMVDLSPVADVKNIFLLGQLGTPTGDVLADILLGKSYPSGKLTMTWANLDDYPSTEGFGDMDDTDYKEGIYVGYRYFDTAAKKPLYPFGYGLSFTEFEIGDLAVSVEGTEITVNCIVINTGSALGKEIVQVFVSAPKGKLDKPYQELRAFKKTNELKPGESEELSITFEAASMSSYDENAAAYLLEKGDYIIRVGNCSDYTTVAAIVRLEETVTTEKLRNICPGCNREDMKLEAVYTDDLTNVPVKTIEPDAFLVKEAAYSDLPEEILAGETISWNKVISKEASIESFAAGLSDEQLTYLVLGCFQENQGGASVIGASALSVAGAAGETTDRLRELDLPSIVMADGPAGLRLCTQYKMVRGLLKGIDQSLSGMMEFCEKEELEAMLAQIPLPS